MKLQNKKTLKVVDVEIKSAFYENIVNIKLKDKKTGAVIALYKTLAELNEEWQDYEEPKGIQGFTTQGEDIIIRMGSIEETEKAVEKLKAWTRLKDKGFRFTAWYGGSKSMSYEIASLENETYIPRQICDDLDLLFSGGEE